jgi:predicted nucleic acid-binding protein
MPGDRPVVLLDTDIFINFLRGREEEGNFFYRAVVLGEFRACYSSINELELFAARHLDSEQEKAINELLASMQRLDVSAPVSRLAGRLLGEYRKNRGLEMPDAIIASTAIVHSATLISRNTKHYAFIPGLLLSTPAIYSGK